MRGNLAATWAKCRKRGLLSQPSLEIKWAPPLLGRRSIGDLAVKDSIKSSKLNLRRSRPLHSKLQTTRCAVLEKFADSGRRKTN
jgi:hypothetical protein